MRFLVLDFSSTSINLLFLCVVNQLLTQSLICEPVILLTLLLVDSIPGDEMIVSSPLRTISHQRLEFSGVSVPVSLIRVSTKLSGGRPSLVEPCFGVHVISLLTGLDLSR